jgi:hypothetical protein
MVNKKLLKVKEKKSSTALNLPDASASTLFFKEGYKTPPFEKACPVMLLDGESWEGFFNIKAR